MDRERFQQIKSIFQSAVQCDGEARSAYLDGVCRGDPALRAEIERMLETREEVEHFLEAPAVAQVAGGLEAVSDFPPGGIVAGKYTIKGVLGEGGMGVVYLAEQTRPVRRDVALKVVKLGMDTRAVIARFEAERQALALMNHPNIAKVLDAGATETGRPFFVMERAPGGPITEYCDVLRLKTKERLRLFLDLCRAIQHAHQKGIIHRDLKPSNILVAREDGAHSIKVIDFGIAKATDRDLTDLTLVTAPHQLLGTPAYMSPEQVVGGGNVDMRTDVYSLGAILYELLTGAKLFDSRVLRDPGYAEAVRTIREVEPSKPSTRVSSRSRWPNGGTGSEGQLLEVARARRTHPAALRKQLRNDLDWIVMKALEKEPGRRYEMVSALASDVERYLNDEPVSAGPPDTWYVLRKFAKRRKGILTAVTAIAVLIIGFAVAMYFKSEENLKLAESEREAKVRLAKNAQRLERQLEANKLERGRLLGRTRNLLAAENLIWPEFFVAPDSPQVLWTLRELYYTNPCLAHFRAHQDVVWETIFSADGKLLITCSEDKTIKLWDAATLEHVRTLEGHEAGVTCLAIRPGPENGGTLASSDTGGTIRFWDLQSGAVLRTTHVGHEGLWTFCFNPDGKRLATGGADSPVRIWDADSWECEAVHTVDARNVWGLRFSPDGRTLACAARDSSIRLWSEPFLSAPAIVHHPYGNNRTLAFTQDGGTLITAGGERVIRFWDTATGENIRAIDSPTATIRKALVSGNGRTLITGGWYAVDFWDLSSYRRFRSLPNYYAVWGLGLDPDEKTLATGFKDGSVRVWELAPSRNVRRLGRHDRCTAVAVSPDGGLIATGDSLGTVRTWETASGRLLSTIEAGGGSVGTIRFSPDGTNLAWGRTDKKIVLWDLEKGVSRGGFDAYVGGRGAFDFGPRGETVTFIAPDRRSVRTVDLADGLPRTRMETVDGGFRMVHADPVAGGIIACTRETMSHEIWHLSDNRRYTHAVKGTILAMAVSGDGRSVAVVVGPDIHILHLPDLSLMARLRGHAGRTRALAFHRADPNLLLSSSDANEIRIWDVAEQRCLATFDGFPGMDRLFFDVCPKGDRIVCASGKEEVILFDLAYYDRYVAGNLAFHMERLEGELPADLKRESLFDWANEVAKRPLPFAGFTPIHRSAR